MNEYERIWAEINLDLLAQNMKAVRSWVSPQEKIMAIVKADGYGHGAVEVSKTLLYHGADWLGVAILDEGIALRENNIYVPILVLGYTPENRFPLMIEHQLIQTIFSYPMAKRLSEFAVAAGKSAQVHIKIDTGMGRLGFLPTEDSIKEIFKIQQLPGLELTGIYTHFALSDCDDESYTYVQYQDFQKFCLRLEQNGVKIPLKHVSNSGAIVGCTDISADMVRTGILLYGLKPSIEMSLKGLKIQPVMSLKTQISYLKYLETGVSVGYGRSYVTQKKTFVATIPVGYADGYSYALGNRGRVLIRGVYAPIIGKICMDQMMVDVTHIAGVRAGDEVVLIGQQGGNQIFVDELAKIQQTISYEIVCCIGKRVPRAYIKNNENIKLINL